MATVQIAFGKPMSGVAPVLGGRPSSSEMITSSGTSQASTGAAQSNDIVSVTSAGGNIWIQIGSNPTAAAGSDYLIPAGGTKDFSCAAGDKVAVIDV